MFTAISQVEGYWHGLFDQEGHIPARTAVDPRGIEQVLEFAMILERIAPGIARIRLAGAHLTDLMGMEVRGMPLTAFFVPDVRGAITDAIEAVCLRNRIVDIDLRSNGGSGRALLEGRLFLAPLLDERGNCNRILACLQTKGQIGRTPRRFDAATCSARSLQAARSFPVSQPADEAGAFSESAAGFEPSAKKAGKSRKPHLRLVYSAD